MHVLGIDAGGSKTVALLADGSGRVVAEARGGGANLQVHGELEVEKTLHAVIDELLSAHKITPAAACLGIAGVDRERDGQTIRHVIRRLGFREHALIVNDALIALVAGGGMGPGLVLVSGTGSIAYGVSPDGVAARAGGWGSALGDEGSAYWIGRRALAAVTREADGRGPSTKLTALVLEQMELSRPQQLIAAIYDGRHDPRAIAELVATVERARAEGDATATAILSDAAAELALAASSVVTRLSMRDVRFPTFLSGGTLRSTPWLAAEVTRRLEAVAPKSEVSILDVEPALGAVRLALEEVEGRAKVPPYIDTVTATPTRP
jgi:N-acetylglucosamine kinase-like BadF-type ATPase